MWRRFRPKTIRPAGIASTVWLFAKEFGWERDYIIWELSECQIGQIEHAIMINKGFEVRRQSVGVDSIIDSILDGDK